MADTAFFECIHQTQPPAPKNLEDIMSAGDFTSCDSDVIKSIIDIILDTCHGVISDKSLRAEMELQKTVFLGRNVYELWVWSFEEEFVGNSFVDLLKEAVAEAREPGMDLRIIAQAVVIRISP